MAIGAFLRPTALRLVAANGGSSRPEVRFSIGNVTEGVGHRPVPVAPDMEMGRRAMLEYLVIAAAMGEPQLAELKTFKDWIVACDNGLQCQASAMIPDFGSPTVTQEVDYFATLTVRRGPEGDAIPQVWLHTDTEADDVAVDGRKLGIHLAADRDEGYVVARRDVLRLLRAIGSAQRVAVVGPAGKASEPVQAAGATAAMLYMDEKQHRLGTRGALVRPGNRPDNMVPPPPSLPIRYSVKGSDKPPLQLSKAFIAEVRKANGCGDEDDRFVDHVRLDDRHTLASITLECVSGAYNSESLSFIITDAGGEPQPARFDYPNDGTNLYWNDRDRRLQGLSKGRGVGDCGTSTEWVWDGEQFRLVRIDEMPVCRGVIDFLPRWRAQVAERRSSR